MMSPCRRPALLAVPLVLALTHPADAQQATRAGTLPPPTDATATRIAERAPATLEDIVFEVGDVPARVVDTHDGGLVVTFAGRPGSRAEIPAENVPADVLYEVELVRRAPRTADAWQDLADTARDLGLHLRRLGALRHAADAGASGPALEQALAEARADYSRLRIERARELIDAGDAGAAREHLQSVTRRFPDSDLAAEARRELTRIDEASGSDDDTIRERWQEVREAGEDVVEVWDRIEAGRDLLRSGMDAADDYVEATRRYEQALEELTEAARQMGGVDTLTARRPGAATTASRPAGEIEQPAEPVTLAKERQRLRVQTRELLVRTHVELGYVLLARGDDKEAYGHATRAAALDPDAAQVSDLRRAIAASEVELPGR